jgi:hypothetical protein
MNMARNTSPATKLAPLESFTRKLPDGLAEGLMLTD